MPTQPHHHISHSGRKYSHDEDDEDGDHTDDEDDYADIEHDFDNDENEEALLLRLETLGDSCMSSRSKHKTFEGIPK